MANQTKSYPNAFAEVIESSLHCWHAQTWHWKIMPSFGSLVAIHDAEYTAFGLVTGIQTGSNDPQRVPQAYQKTEEELLREQPQIFEFLQTTFTCIPVGYQKSKTIIYQIPPQPAKIHAFISTVTKEEAQAFFANSSYLHLLFEHAPSQTIDELLLALLQQLRHHHQINSDHIRDFIDTYCVLTAHDYRRLKIFLHRVQAILYRI